MKTFQKKSSPLFLFHKDKDLNLRWKIAQAAEIRWWQNYLNGKSEKDYIIWKKEYWTNFLKQINVMPTKGTNVLDVGCGPAGIFINLAEQKVTALDPLLDQYSEKLPHFSPQNYPWTDFVTSPFEKYQTKQQFDTIFCLNAINHVADLDLCFDKLVSLTKSGGTLVVSIDAHNYSLFKHLFRLIPGDILHPHQYDLKEYEQMLTDRNCTLTKTELIKSEFFFDYYCLVVTKNA